MFEAPYAAICSALRVTSGGMSELALPRGRAPVVTTESSSKVAAPAAGTGAWGAGVWVAGACGDCAGGGAVWIRPAIRPDRAVVTSSMRTNPGEKPALKRAHPEIPSPFSEEAKGWAQDEPIPFFGTGFACGQ